MARILVVEDSEGARQMVSRLLEMDGYETVCVSNGVEALESLAQGPPADLILLDVMMPEMDGLTFLSQIRENPTWKRLPVIMMTARLDAETQDRATVLGATDYLVKARFTADEMLKHIKRQLPPI